MAYNCVFFKKNSPVDRKIEVLQKSQTKNKKKLVIGVNKEELVFKYMGLSALELYTFDTAPRILIRLVAVSGFKSGIPDSLLNAGSIQGITGTCR